MLKSLQTTIYQNKINKGFNVSDIPLEFTYLYGEVWEAFEAWRKKKDDLWEELADVTIYLLGLAEILWYDMDIEILKKMEKNATRNYITQDNGTNVRIEE